MRPTQPRGPDSPLVVIAAIRAGHVVLSVPTVLLLVGPFLFLMMRNPAPSGASVAVAAVTGIWLACCYRMLAAPAWRLRAYRSVRLDDLGDLRAQALWAGFAWPKGHVLERFEWKSPSQRAEEQQLEAAYLQRFHQWPEMPSYDESPETKIRTGTSVVLLLSVTVLIWRSLSPDYFTQLRPNSLLLYLGALDVSVGILLWNSPIAARAFSGYWHHIDSLLILVGVIGLSFTDFGVLADQGFSLTAPAIVPIVLALLGLKR